MFDSAQAAATLLALSILPLIRRFGYEAFLTLHRALMMTLLVALWHHIGPRQTLSRILLEAGLATLLASIGMQAARQVYKNTSWTGCKVQIVHTSTGRRCGDTLIVRIALARPWRIQPGNYIHLRLLTLKFASLLQSHPFVITWWDDVEETKDAIAEVEPHAGTNRHPPSQHAGKAQVLYVMIDPQRGWTRRVMGFHRIFDNRAAWLAGPFGSAYRLEQYSTVMLFASDSGIFAQLPLLKGILLALRRSPSRTKKVRLIWQTDVYHEQLQEWMHDILRDDKLDKDVGNKLRVDARFYC